jgi:hypothetical protein
MSNILPPNWSIPLGMFCWEFYYAWSLIIIVAMGQFFPFQPPPDEYPNHLALPRPEKLRLPQARWLLLFLVLLCLTPRVVMALRIPSVCPDGVLYVHLAQSIEAGDLKSGFREMSLNIYPLILVAMHRIGFEWEYGGLWWGVAISSLVVLPLWGWARRQFDDRVALVACLLYIVHPKFIEWSPEVMRDPTFWFLFMTAIYLLWRAVTEVRYGFFLAAGAAILLATMTRIEGLFLLIPLVFWTFWRFRALETDRRKLLLGVVLSVAFFPAILVLVNLVWLCGQGGLRLDPIIRAAAWLQSAIGHADASGVGMDKPLPFRQMLWVFFPTMTRGLSSVFALLMFGGIWGWRRIWARRDHQPLFLAALALLCGIWIQMSYDKNICPRYALPIVLMASVFAALGLLGLLNRLSRIAAWLSWSGRTQSALRTMAVVLLLPIGLIEAMTSNVKYFETRRMAAAIGCWVDREFPSRPTLAGPVGITPIVSYYAHNAPYQAFVWEADDPQVLATVAQSGADVVLLRPAKELTQERCVSLVDRMRDLGLHSVDPVGLQGRQGDCYLLVRESRLKSLR